MTDTLIHIPELVEGISQYLRASDWTRCVRVCKTWHDAFAPLLYRQIAHDSDSLDKQPPWSGIQRHCRHIRTLALTASSFPEQSSFGSECCHLTSLSLGPLYYMEEPSQWSLQLKSLIARNPFIYTMRITLQNDLSKVLFRDDNILKHVPGLKNLTIMMDFYPTSSPIDVADHNGTGGVFEAVLECGHQLQSLTYEVLGRGSSISGDIEGLDSTINNNNNNNNSNKETASWTRLSSLTLYDQDGCRGIELLKRSPNLKHLKAVIHRQRYPEALQQMVKTYSSGQHPSCLEHLELLRLEGSRGQAALKELLQVSAQSTGLKTFSLDLSCVSATVLTTLLEHHATSLEKMVEIDSMGLSADNVCSLLTKCPRLKHVEASIWSDGPWLQDVLQSPWICADLRNLHLKVRPRSMWSSWERGGGRRSNDQDVKERIPEPRKQFWLQIGALKDLECVHLNLDPTHPLSTDLLTIEREDLEPLIGLRRLKEIRIPHGNKFMGVGVKEELQRRRPGLRIVYN